MAIGIPNFSFGRREDSKLNAEQISALQAEYVKLDSERKHLGSEELNSGKLRFDEREKIRGRMEEIERRLAQNDVFIGQDAEAA